MDCSARAFNIPRVPVSRPTAKPTETAERWTSEVHRSTTPRFGSVRHRPASIDTRNLRLDFLVEKLLPHFAESTSSHVTFPSWARFRLEWVAGSSAQKSHADTPRIQRGSDMIEPGSHRDRDLPARHSSTQGKRGMMHRAARVRRRSASAWECPRRQFHVGVSTRASPHGHLHVGISARGRRDARVRMPVRGACLLPLRFERITIDEHATVRLSRLMYRLRHFARLIRPKTCQ
ncbi:MAG: hypothetical protein RL354_1057 [Planctomycetota bacterium]